MPLWMFFVTIILVSACGRSERIIERQVPVGNGGSGGGSGGGGVIAFPDLQPSLRANCALSNCHAGASFTSNEASFLRGTSCSRIRSGNMPRRSSPRYDQWSQSDINQFDQFCRLNGK